MKILVVDDDPQILEALRLGFQLQWQGSTVLSARSGDEAIRVFFDQLPDVVLLDVTMPGKNGYEVLKEIRQVSDVPVVMLTARGEEIDQVRGLELGADDYVVKPFSHMALLARIRAVLRRAEMPPPLRSVPDLVAGDLTVHFQSQQVVLRGERVRLTPVEYKLLYHLVRNAGRVVPHQALINQLWGEAYGATTAQLKVFVSRLRSKIEPEGGPRYIETQRGLGYRFVPPPKDQ